MRMDCEEKLLLVKEGKLFCSVVGNHHRPVIVLHGGPGLGHRYLLPQMEEIGKFSRAIFYDQRGTGKSKSNDAWHSQPFETYVNDIEEVRKQFGFESVSLLSHSWGSMLASLYALSYPERVSDIIYLNAVPISSKNYLAFVEHRNHILNVNKDELTALRESNAFKRGDTETVEKYYRLYFKNYFAKPELLDQLTIKMSPEAAINNFKIFELFYNYTVKHTFDLYDGMKKFSKPSLIIAGDKDVIPFHYMEHLHRTIPASQLVLIKECGHFPYIDQLALMLKTIQDFYSRC